MKSFALLHVGDSHTSFLLSDEMCCCLQASISDFQFYEWICFESAWQLSNIHPQFWLSNLYEITVICQSLIFFMCIEKYRTPFQVTFKSTLQMPIGSKQKHW